MSYKPFVFPPVTHEEDVPGTQNSGVNEANVPTVPTVPGFRNSYIYSEGVPNENNDSDHALYTYLFPKTGNSGNNREQEPIYSRESDEKVLHTTGNTGNNTGNTDLTCYIGYTIDAAGWAWLKAECQRRHGPTWQLSAEQCSEGYKVTGLRVMP